MVPLFYAISSFLMTLLTCALYNLVAPQVGGLCLQVTRE